ncbi:hypothetical protein BO99DRAFT_225967 [Aspergillus violaceofuscus CBS 115571]|uniref:Secreted protein n=1 Tax=Aspergillus violaceofuscus (strain CBS 115571) TaxID=1450538 RepID=A0A2V5H673_ASPV1|nr:hypothetical protein BO99DRAFT_225967 [Aspergillus violaceofuscus CBS 115571]
MTLHLQVLETLSLLHRLILVILQQPLVEQFGTKPPRLAAYRAMHRYPEFILGAPFNRTVPIPGALQVEVGGTALAAQVHVRIDTLTDVARRIRGFVGWVIDLARQDAAACLLGGLQAVPVAEVAAGEDLFEAAVLPDLLEGRTSQLRAPGEEHDGALVGSVVAGALGR